jgi:hypothetical protein
MMVFAIRIEHPLDVTVQGSHDADPRKHRRAAVTFGDQDQGLNRGLPFLDLLFCLRQFLDLLGSVLQRDDLATARQRDRIIERPFPAPARQCRQPFLSNSVLKPFGGRGADSSSLGLHRGQGAPAAPQMQACSPFHGRSGWASQPSRSPGKTASHQRRIPASNLGL